MNNLEIWIYLIGVFDNLNCACGIIWVLAIICCLFRAIYVLVEGVHESEILAHKKNIKKLFLVFCVFLSINVFIPSKEAMYAMLGVNTIKQMASHEKVDDITQKSILLLEKKLDELLGGKGD